MEKITSLQNNQIKNIRQLSAKNKERKLQGLFVLEGARELSLALEGNYQIESLYICPKLFEKSDYPEIIRTIDSNALYEITPAIFQKIAYRESSDGIFALVKSKSHTLSELKLRDNPFIILLEAIEKPGNLGAILRTSDAAGADAVVVCDPLTDLYNPNIIRSSVGCLFTVPIAVCSNEEALEFLQNKQIRSFAAELTATQIYQDVDFTLSSAIIMGTEANGLTPFWLKNADVRIKIPMRGVIDSLNVSVSTAIIAFEAMRQRSRKYGI
ncbi:MAG: RNA methyltransferase [Dysgonamonadaceae bacterium]|jgi:TrmH family RNA methyltransferase|nr:RNA methyltransferase [Dysgonamonadaceae bacterium]